MDFYELLGCWPYVLPVAGSAAVWVMRRTFVGIERVEKLENRLTEMETKYANMPTAEDMHEMRLRMSELAGDMKVCSQGLRALTHQIELLLENAVNRGK